MPPATILAPSADSAPIPGPGSLPAPRKWTDATGYVRHPAAVKAALAALGKAKSLASYHIEVSGTLTPGHESTPWTDPGARCETVAFLLGLSKGDASPEALRRYCAIGDAHAWTLTRENAPAISAECLALVRASADPASGVLTVQDQRRPAAEVAAECARLDRARAEREAKDATKEAAIRARAVEWRRAIGDSTRDLHAAARFQCGPIGGAGWLDVAGLPGVRVADLRSAPRSGGPSDALRALLPYGVLLGEGERYGVPADAIRTMIHMAQEAGILMPCKVSVRTERGNSVTINITQTPANPETVAIKEWRKANPHGSYADAPARHLPEVESALAVLGAIARLWHWDESDSMTDYHSSRYFIHVGLAYPFDATPYTLPASLREGMVRAQGQVCEPAPASVVPAGWRVEHHLHSRKQRAMVLAIPSARTDMPTFQRWSIHAQDKGGWYSRKWGRTPGGFAWWADENGEAQALAFIAWTQGSTPPPSPTGPGPGASADGPAEGTDAKFPTMLACSSGKAFQVLAIERTREDANAACERTGGGVLCEGPGCIVIASATPEPSGAYEYPGPLDKSPLRLTNDVRLLIARGGGRWGLVLGIDEADRRSLKGEGLRQYLAANSYGRKPVEMAQLPDGRQVFADAYGRGLGKWHREQPRADASAQTAAQYREAKAAELRRGVSAHAADRVESLAEGLEAEAERKLASRLENTPKRQRQAGAARVEGYRMRRAASILRAWAGAARVGFPAGSLLPAVPTKVEAIRVATKPNVRDGRTGYYDAPVEDTDPNAWTDTSPRAAALRALLTAADAAREQEQARAQAKAAELAELRRSDLPGFFPTPEPLARRMVELAGDLYNKTIFDPSCGIGSLLDLAAGPYTRCYGVELVPKLAQYCERWGRALKVECRDFLAKPAGEGSADVILMNPPFEKGAAPVHVRHALRFLNRGGVLVAVLPAQVRSKGELEDLAPEWHDVEDGAFASARDAIRQTGVAVALCVLRKES